MNPSGALSVSSSPCVFPYFTYLELILVAVTFFWYGREKRPQPQLLSIETRAATCQSATTQSPTVAFSVPDFKSQDYAQDALFPYGYFWLDMCQCAH